MKLGSLFSGGGLGDFGFMASGMEIAWQCEIDEYCQKILALRYPESKKYTDIKTLKGSELEKVDIITGGFPCQPFSTAGRRKGNTDDRNLWPEMFRIIRECRPRWVVGENVNGYITLGLEHLYSDLESENYEVRSISFSAHSCGAWHKRDRLWIIAHTRLLGQTKHEKLTVGIEECSNLFRNYWKSEPSVGRVANGVADRVHRLKMLGNGQVPACTYVIGKMIKEIEQQICPAGKEMGSIK